MSGSAPSTETPEMVIESRSAPGGASRPGCPEKTTAPPRLGGGGRNVGGVIWLAVWARTSVAPGKARTRSATATRERRRLAAWWGAGIAFTPAPGRSGGLIAWVLPSLFVPKSSELTAA